MAERTEVIRIVELDTFDRHGGRTLMVRLPSNEGRSRVAFVPMKDPGAMTEAMRARLVEELLTT